MSAKAVSELSGKEVLYRQLASSGLVDAPKAVRLTEKDNFDEVVKHSEWLMKGDVSGFFKMSKLCFVFRWAHKIKQCTNLVLNLVYPVVSESRDKTRPTDQEERKTRPGQVRKP